MAERRDSLLYTSGFATTQVVVPGDCNEKFALRIFYISDANERPNQPLWCTTIHAIFLLTVRQIRMFF